MEEKPISDEQRGTPGYCQQILIRDFQDAENVMSTFKTLLQMVRDTATLFFRFCQLLMKFLICLTDRHGLIMEVEGCKDAKFILFI